MDPQGAAPRLRAALALCAVLAVAAWEAAQALLAPGRVPSEADWAAAAAAARQALAPNDLIVVAPRWAEPVARRHLGDLMPAAMLGRPDEARYGRILELSMRGARAPEAAGLPLEAESAHGRVTLRRYRRQAATVTADLVADLLSARVGQAPMDAPAGAPEQPCLWGGPAPGPPGSAPPRGEAGAFRCRGSRVERRTMEIDYAPRYGVVVPAEPGLRTVLEYDLPAQATDGAELVVYAGLHDYYARKTESGPADLVVDFDHGKQRAALSVAPSGWHRLAVRPPGPGAHVVRIEVSARDARARNVGFAAEVRR